MSGPELTENAAAPRELIARMCGVIEHRGPDDEGHYIEPGIAMGMRRLSIIDLAGGHQPLSNLQRTLWVVCNGEIYNFRELRRELEHQGHRFQTGSGSLSWANWPCTAPRSSAAPANS